MRTPRLSAQSAGSSRLSSMNRKFPRILIRLHRLIVGVLEMSAQACFTNVLVAGNLHKLKEVRHAEVMGTQHD